MRQELNPAPRHEIWSQVNADSSTCSRKNCNPDHCYYQKAKGRIQEANVLILNHSLLFALIGAGMQPEGNASGILYDFVVDEVSYSSHITEHFGLDVVIWRRVMLKLLQSSKKRSLPESQRTRTANK